MITHGTLVFPGTGVENIAVQHAGWGGGGGGGAGAGGGRVQDCTV